jgi:hypothetical protein
MSIQIELDTEVESSEFQKKFLELFNLNKKELKKNYKFKIINYPKKKGNEKKFKFEIFYANLEFFKILSSFIDKDQSNHNKFKINWEKKIISAMSEQKNRKEIERRLMEIKEEIAQRKKDYEESKKKLDEEIQRLLGEIAQRKKDYEESKKKLEEENQLEIEDHSEIWKNRSESDETSKSETDEDGILTNVSSPENLSDSTNESD